MDWIRAVNGAIPQIEDSLTEEIALSDIAKAEGGETP